MTSSRRMALLAAAGIAEALGSQARALVFYSTGDSAYNTTAPTGALANSGWQWQGSWGGWYTGTPIAPQFFVTANHVGGTVGQSLTLNGVNYKTVPFSDSSPYKQIPGTDLRLWKTSGTFASYAPLYDTTTDGSEVGKTFFFTGRGGQRGSQVVANSQLKGWLTTNSGDPGFDHVRRWGQNKIAGITDLQTSGDNQEVYYFFDASGLGNVGANEATLSVGDSGGGMFIQVGGAWKLAGLIYGVSGPYAYPSDPNTTFNAAIFDQGGLYVGPAGNNALVTDLPVDQPGYGFLDRISPNLTTINGDMSAAAGSPVWNVNASGNWSTGSNWWNGTAPNGTGAEAVLGSVISTSRTVTMDANKTVGTLTIDSSHGYTIGGTHTLTIQGTSGTGVIRAYQGSHTISSPLKLVGTSQIQLGQTTPTVHNATLTISGSLNATGATIQKQGAGTLIVNNIRSANLQVQQGIVKTAANGGNSGVTHLSSLSISSGAALDMNDNDLIVDYTGSSPFTQIQAWVLNGYSTTVDAGKSGITSSASQSSGGNTILALFDNALEGAGEWPPGSGMTVASDSIIGKYTYFGDTNLDGQVTAADYNAVDAGLGTTGVAPGKAWLMGDTNFDGDITAADYNAIDARLGMGVGNPLSISSVPEPGTLGLFGAGWLLLRRRRRRPIERAD